MKTNLNKQALRSHYQTIRKQLSPTDQTLASSKVCQHIQTLDIYRNATHIGMYAALNGEINLMELMQHHDKIFYYPVMTKQKTLSFFPVTPDTVFCKNHVGIAEPHIESASAIMPEQLDIMFLPLVAFDEYGTRLGMGGGYYDRALANHRPTWLIGVAYECQRHTYIERDPWDIPLAAIITERTIYWSTTP